MNKALFTDQVLNEIVQHIIVPNLTATELDEENFEDNPTDYIRKDMEGSDSDTRRRSAMELVRSLLQHFNEKTTHLCLTYISSMLEEYRNTLNWKAKDVALHLIFAIAVKSSSAIIGAGELNSLVNIQDIFNSHILPEVQDRDVNSRPIVKADATKMICVFRTHLPQDYLLNLLPHIVRLLGSKHVVIQTYAALCIERFLSVKDRNTAGQSVNRITKDHVVPHLQSLMSGLFSVLENPDLPENDYVMKCIMRVLSLIGSDVVPITGLVLAPLTSTLERVCNNPSNPHFNHYLFECLAVLIKSVCSSSSDTLNGVCDQFEALLFPPFQAVLSQDVVEFVPYVFQVLAQLLNSRPKGTPLSDSFKVLFPPLLMPVLWDRKGNVPALTDLIRAYTCKGMAEIIQGNHLTGVLGVFQKLLASKVSEQFAFKLLDGLICNTTSENLDPFIATIFNLLLTKMQTHMKVSKTNKYCRSFIHSMCLYSSAYGGQKLYDVISGIDANLINTLITQVWTPNSSLCAGADLLEIKHMIVGGTYLLCNTPVNTHPELWGSLLLCIMTLIDVDGVKVDGFDDLLLLIDEEAEEREFDSTYSRLAFAVVPDAELQNEIQSPNGLFCASLSTVCKSSPGSYLGVIQGVLTPRLTQILQQKMQESGQTIV